MLNIYDIILNLLDTERVYESFEWSKKDNIEHIKKIPMIRVNSETLKDIIDTTFVIDKELLSEIFKKTEIYNDDGLSIVEYAALFTDNFKVVAVEFNSSGKSLFKSNLLFDEEEEILEISNEVKVRNIDYKVIKRNKNNLFLTRDEEIKRNYLIKEIKSSYRRKKYEKINYLYDEIYNKNSNESIIYKYKTLINDITNNYSDIHIKLYHILKLTYKKKTTSN